VTGRESRTRRFRELVCEAIEAMGGPDTPILFSGGVDSATILFGALSLGGRPTLYTYRLSTGTSRDALTSRLISRHFRVPLRVVVIERRPDVLERDVRRVIRLARTSIKVHVQVSQPTLYLAEAIARDGHSLALTGVGADDLYATNRKLKVYVHFHGEVAGREARRLSFFRPDSSERSMKRVASSVGVTLRDVFDYEPLNTFILDQPTYHIHDPFQKALAVEAFGDYWRQGAWYREHENLQVCSGLREWHDTLLRSHLNRRESLSVVAIYNDLLAEEFTDE
jgi:asparagine synthetase B (glutamine-hydrolysing)